MKVCSPGKLLRCALIDVESKGHQSKTGAGNKGLTGAFLCLLSVCVCLQCQSVPIQQLSSEPVVT